MDTLVFIKLICCCVVLLLNSVSAFSIFFIIQTKFLQRRKLSTVWQRGLSMANCFCIGLFLSVCFLGLYNSATVKMHTIQANTNESSFLKTYPISEFILCVDLLILWIIEWTFRSCIVSSKFVARQINVPHAVSMEPVEESEYSDSEIDLLAPLCHSSSSVAPNQCRLKNTESIPTLSDRSSFLKVGFIMGAMSIHTILESLGFGLLDSRNQVTTMALAMSIHQILCSGTLGFRVSSACGTPRSRFWAILLLIGYLCLLPVGTLTGSLLHGDRFTTSSNHPYLSANNSFTDSNQSFNCSSQYNRCIFMSVMQLFAASAFLYVVFIEMLPNEVAASMPTIHANQPISIKRGIYSCLSAIFGFLLIAGVRLIHHNHH